jgi:hypothetical protein
MKNAYFLVLSGALFAYNAAHAQVVTTPVEPPSVAQVPQEQPPVAAQPPAATSQPQAAASTSPATESRRDEVRAMEVFLMGALQKGAQDLARQLRVNEPNSAFVTGTGRARGFVLEGYGMFFDVDVPGMKQSVIWSAQMLQLEQDRQSYARFLATAAPDDPRRKFVEERLRNVQVLMASQTGTILLTPPAATADMTLPPGRVGATVAVAEGAPTVPPPPASSFATQIPPAPSSPVQALRDPNELYTDSVKNAIIDVMLRHSAFLKIRDNEWLTVAASDSDGPQTPGQVEELSRIIISIRGADLMGLHTNKLTREEVLKRVTVREF